MFLEDVLDDSESTFSDSHLEGSHISSTLSAFWLTSFFISLFKHFIKDLFQLLVDLDIEFGFECFIVAELYEHEVVHELSRAYSELQLSGSFLALLLASLLALAFFRLILDLSLLGLGL